MSVFRMTEVDREVTGEIYKSTPTAMNCSGVRLKFYWANQRVHGLLEDDLEDLEV